MLSLRLKKTQLIFFTTSLLIWIASYLLFYTKCLGVTCGSDLLRGIIFPVFWLAGPMSGIVLLFLFIPSAIFHTWLRHIAWWYLPLLFFAILSTPIYSGNVLSFDRSQIAFGGVVLLAVITLPYLGWRMWRR